MLSLHIHNICLNSFLHTSWAFSAPCNMNYVVMMKSVFIVFIAGLQCYDTLPRYAISLYVDIKNNGIFRLHFYAYFADIFHKKINEKSNFKEINPLFFALLI